MFDDLLEGLAQSRRAHSREVGRKAQSQVGRVPAWLRADLVAAACLHDIGYAHPSSGFHPLDGAHYLRSAGFSLVVCNLVAHHSASTVEAELRGIPASEYALFDVRADVEPAHRVLWWADLTTGPTGRTVRVEERLAEIAARYGPGDIVTEFVNRARPVLLDAGRLST